jgi:hypothetical protein
VTPKRHATAANNTPVSSSTAGYCHEIGVPQARQRPRSARKLSSGMFSQAASEWPQRGQCERSTTMPGGAAAAPSGKSSSSRLSRSHCHCRRRGRRRMTTLRKLPVSRPRAKALAAASAGCDARRASTGRAYIVAASLKIGRYMPTTMPPTMPPMKIMMKGSIRLASASTALLTSCS